MSVPEVFVPIARFFLPGKTGQSEPHVVIPGRVYELRIERQGREVRYYYIVMAGDMHFGFYLDKQLASVTQMVQVIFKERLGTIGLPHGLLNSRGQYYELLGVFKFTGENIEAELTSALSDHDQQHMLPALVQRTGVSVYGGAVDMRFLIEIIRRGKPIRKFSGGFISPPTYEHVLFLAGLRIRQDVTIKRGSNGRPSGIIIAGNLGERILPLSRIKEIDQAPESGRQGEA